MSEAPARFTLAHPAHSPTHQNLTLTAVLFAGGESRRMGTDKSTLLFRGEPLWSRQLQILHRLNPAQILISARTKSLWCPSDVTIVLDENTNRCGPLAGLAASLSRIHTTHLLALAIDLPLMTADHLQSLWNGCRPGRGIVPVTPSGLEPLCAIYPAEALPAARTALAGPDTSLRRFIQSSANQLRFHSVPASDLPLYRNLNTPVDLHQATAEMAAHL